jgi:hypothetical protein
MADDRRSQSQDIRRPNQAAGYFSSDVLEANVVSTSGGFAINIPAGRDAGSGGLQVPDDWETDSHTTHGMTSSSPVEVGSFAAPFFGSMSLGYGTSPGRGRGLGHLMRRPTWDSLRTPLPSHDELGDLLEGAETLSPRGDLEASPVLAGFPVRRPPVPPPAEPSAPLPAGAEAAAAEPSAPLLPMQPPASQSPAQIKVRRWRNSLESQRSASSDLNTSLLPPLDYFANDRRHLRPDTPTPAGAASPAASGGTAAQTAAQGLAYGTINAIAAIPALVAFAAIVFREPVYAPYLDRLCKMFFLSSALHQGVFCLLSSLPYAVGQVQDVGLIFLSAMATSVAGLVKEAGGDADTALATSLWTMTISTLLVGLGTLFVGESEAVEAVGYSFCRFIRSVVLFLVLFVQELLGKTLIAKYVWMLQKKRPPELPILKSPFLLPISSSFSHNNSPVPLGRDGAACAVAGGRRLLGVCGVLLHGFWNWTGLRGTDRYPVLLDGIAVERAVAASAAHAGFLRCDDVYDAAVAASWGAAGRGGGNRASFSCSATGSGDVVGRGRGPGMGAQTLGTFIISFFTALRKKEGKKEEDATWTQKTYAAVFTI